LLLPGHSTSVNANLISLKVEYGKIKPFIDEFWVRYTSEYLSSLHTWRRSLKCEYVPPSVGDLVLLESHVSSDRSKWPTGVIVAVFPGSDKVIRQVTVRLASGKQFRRSVDKLYPLELHTTSPSKQEDGEELWCLCEKPSRGKMIACDSKDCPVSWFHFDCVGISRAPKGIYICPICRGDKT
jgi:hypothetical protein